ncbi:SusC/RagA family TonB-linked outer membrane protein [Bacteroides uniformis]|uniref:SusC/RagA family TonB-linked outer membrane protein n=1 Tax=Bacteroides uniformis TaxID=820 RepID=A0AA37JUN3_BACUN|nr:SusC/RagA family TonB-linked outer membrane protein [Bacteroides uniformis]GKH11818.1 SusC/RagA family TonB-linked outer membrane protein [Bacteroides uniformis]GKH35157.1 SusC/RagA family TonB-linked outer membrane protein [Bacteroides uniformis]
MNLNSFKRNRKALTALLICTGFITTHPLAAFAGDNVPAVQMVQQQKQSVSGIVKDSTGEPIIGANIREKENPSNGTITDIDGNFSIKVAPGAVLEISFIGYKTVEVKAVAGKPLNVTLTDDNEMLEEVVVVGYGSMRKKDLTGSVIQIRPEKLANEAPKTVQDVLRGTPGLNVGYDASAKGGGMMQIRGQRSVYQTDNEREKDTHNAPLIILDGMQFYGELSEINPNDIGQIDVLKDASSAAVYGAKAANGVIIITTKKGKTGKPTVNVSATIGINTKSAYRDVYDAEGYMRYREDWYKKDTYGVDPFTGAYGAYAAGEWKDKTDENGNVIKGPDGKPVQEYIYSRPAGYFENPNNLSKYGISIDQWRLFSVIESGESDASIYAKRLMLEKGSLANYLAGNIVDWGDQTFQTGINQDYSASISGAGERMNYYMSVGYLKNEGAVRGNEYTAMRANMKLNGKVTDWLEIGANVNFQDRSDGDIQVPLGANYWEANMLRNSPYSQLKDADGNYNQYPMCPENKWGYNYDFERQYQELEKGYTVLNTIFNAKVKLPFGITYDFNISPRYQWFYNRYFTSASRPDAVAKDCGADRETAKNFDWTLNNTISWDYTFAEKHHTVLTLVQEAEERRYWQEKITARNILPSDALGFHNVGNATLENSKIESNDTHETAAAYMARLFYSYDDRYMVTGTVRRDGYCAFGANYPWATFPSVSLAWSFTNEKFFKWEPMSSGKLRLSWGMNGNRQLKDPYLSLANLGSGTGATMGYIDAGGNAIDVKYLGMDRLPNSNLQWEKTEAYNVGLDFGFLNDRITGTMEFYNMTTKDMIMGQRLPGFCGFGSITTNLGEVQNRGFELSLSTLNIQNKNFEWRTSFGFSFNDNKIKHLYYEYEDVLDADGNVIGRKEMDDIDNKWFIGKSIGEIWDYEVCGIWQKDEVEEAAKVGQRPGDPKVVNHYTGDDKEDGTPVYNDKDKKFLGKSIAPINWSLRNEFTLWKDLDISFSLYSYMGHKSLEGYYLNQDNAGNMISNNCNTFVKEYWTPENPSNTYARLDAYGPNGAKGVQRLHNRSFIRLDNISVAYTLPQAWTKKVQMERVKVFGTIRNVATWAADWEYGDPETSGLATRTFTFGLNITL